MPQTVIRRCGIFHHGTEPRTGVAAVYADLRAGLTHLHLSGVFGVKPKPERTALKTLFSDIGKVFGTIGSKRKYSRPMFSEVS